MWGNAKVVLDLSSYAAKADLKNATPVDTSKFAKNFDLASLKQELDKLDMGKLETTPVDLSKVGDVVKDNVVKKTQYDELAKKVTLLRLFILTV